MVMERERTDPIFAIIFGICVVIWLAIDIYAISTQDVTRTYAPLDAAHQFCGMGNRKDFKYLFFTDVSGTEPQMYASAVCVKACPTATSNTAPNCFPIPKTATRNAIGCAGQ